MRSRYVRAATLLQNMGETFSARHRGCASSETVNIAAAVGRGNLCVPCGPSQLSVGQTPELAWNSPAELHMHAYRGGKSAHAMIIADERACTAYTPERPLVAEDGEGGAGGRASAHAERSSSPSTPSLDGGGATTTGRTAAWGAE